MQFKLGVQFKIYIKKVTNQKAVFITDKNNHKENKIRYTVSNRKPKIK